MFHLWLKSMKGVFQFHHIFTANIFHILVLAYCLSTLPHSQAPFERPLPLSQMLSTTCHILLSSVRQMVVWKCVRLYIYDFTHLWSLLESQLCSPIRILVFFFFWLPSLKPLKPLNYKMTNHPRCKWIWLHKAIVSYGTQKLSKGPSSQLNLC